MDLPKKYTEEREWGFFERFSLNEPTTVKLMHIKAGKSLHLQTHENRSEFWRVLSGKPTVIIGENKWTANPGDEFFVPKKTKHQIISQDKEDSCILEIARGFFDEHDINHY